MNKREEKEIGSRFLEVYCGILFNSPAFEKGREVVCSYDFSDPRYEELKVRYKIEEIAENGGDFERALRICKWLAPNLTHKGDFAFTSEIEENALSLLDYAFGKSEHGINCVCKAKILVECCLALGIYARRVWLYPNSPYDGDCHVVAEIYDRKRKKWIMLDPTAGGYFTNGNAPLSCLEMREAFARMAEGSIVLPRQNAKELAKLSTKNLTWNYYYAKNCFYFGIEKASTFGETKAEFAYLLPIGFDCKARHVQNAVWGAELAKRENWEETAIAFLEKRLQKAKEFAPLVGSTSLWNAPY